MSPGGARRRPRARRRGLARSGPVAPSGVRVCCPSHLRSRDTAADSVAIASGAVFALHVNSDFSWMFSKLLGLSTKGTPKTLTVATSLGAAVSLPLMLGASVIAGAS